MAPPLVLACGALVSELRAVLASNGLADHAEVRYLPANLHNRPERIVPALIELLDELDPNRERDILVGYADCGTGGQLDALIAERPNLRRLPGDHARIADHRKSAAGRTHALACAQPPMPARPPAPITNTHVRASMDSKTRKPRDWAHPCPHLQQDWAHPRPHLHHDWAHPATCAGTAASGQP